MSDSAATLHYWIVAATPSKRMPLNSSGQGIACAYCGIAYHDAEGMDGCPKSRGALLNA